MRVVSDGQAHPVFDQKYVDRLLRHREERERAEIVRQREVILELEGVLKSMLRLRKNVQLVQCSLNKGHVEVARREVAKVLARWPST